MAMSRRSLLKAVVAAGLAVVVMYAAGCGKEEAGAGGGGGGGAGAKVDPNKKLHLAFVTNNAANFWTIARAGVNKAAEEIPNLTVEFKIPGDASANTQKTLVQDLLSKGVDGIAISPIDPSNQTQFLNEVADKALLITQDSDAPDSKRAAYLGTDNVAAGRQAGDLLKKALPNGGKVVVFVGSMDAQNARDRFNGIKEAIKDSKIEIVDTRTDGTDNVKAKGNVQDTLVKYPDIAGLVGLWSYNGPAILTAVREANKGGKVQVVCFDEEDETLQGVKAGDIYATVVQQPFEFGHQSMILMAKVLRGDKSAIPPGKQVFVPTLAITKENVDTFSADLKKMLGK